jgi:hypothetical protein
MKGELRWYRDVPPTVGQRIVYFLHDEGMKAGYFKINDEQNTVLVETSHKESIRELTEKDKDNLRWDSYTSFWQYLAQ